MKVKKALMMTVFFFGFTACQGRYGSSDANHHEESWSDASGEVVVGDGQDSDDRIDGGEGIEPDDDPIEPACLPWAGLRDEALKQVLHDAVADHQALTYNEARRQIFTVIDNQDGWVECVYTGQKVQTSGIPDISVMNTEHTWCQSWGSDTLPAKSDLNHLFPASAAANSARSNYPFGEVVMVNWESGGSKLGLDGWGSVVFEPRDVHKGDAARAIFYFSIRYNMGVDDRMEEVLRHWNRQDLPDEKEIRRAGKIETIQQRRNLLVDCPRLVDWISNF